LKTKKSSAKKAKFEDEKSAKEVEDVVAKATVNNNNPSDGVGPAAPTPSSPVAEMEVVVPEQVQKSEQQQDESAKLEQLAQQPQQEASRPSTPEVNENASVPVPIPESSPVPPEAATIPTTVNSEKDAMPEPEKPVVEEKKNKRRRKIPEGEVKHDVVELPQEIEQPVPAPDSGFQTNYVVADGPTQQLEQVFKSNEEQEEEKQPPIDEDVEWENGIPSEKAKLPEVEEITVEPTKQKRRGKKRKKQSKNQLEEGEPQTGKKGKNKKKDENETSFSDTLVKVALRYTRAPTRFLAKKMPGLRENLLRSSLRISPEGLIAISLLFTFITVPVSIIGAYLLATHGFALEAYAIPAVSVLPFFIGISIPKISASSRAQSLDNELPYLFAYITVLAGGGISPMVTFKRITKAAKIFPASAKEAKRILMDIDIFGMDAISALERESRITPNKVFADFIGGYVAVLKTGGDALSFLEAKLKEIFAYREVKVRAGSEFIATMSEAYIITTVIMGISLMILFATQNLMSPGITSINPTEIIMFSGFAVPIISLIFIVVIGSSQIREPYSYDFPFYIFLACIPIGAMIYFFLPLHLATYMQLGVALTAISTPPMYFQMKYRRQKSSVESKLPNFLRDISEIRKTGLAPEKTIEQLANRNYGGLSVHVKKIAAQLSWGTPIKTVLQNFTSQVKSWVGQAVAFLLLEVVDVGGGSAKMFISLADFAEKNAQLEKEKKSQVRPYIIIPYIGAILVVATTAMMVYYVSPANLSFPGIGTVGSNYLPSASVIQEATIVLLMGSFFQAWVMGFVAGKMGEGSAADGFKHATFLIIISMITVLVAGFFIKL
jgi:archaeal flagellar protein FlaJ